MNTELLEKKLSEIFYKIMEARNAANEAADMYFKLKQWIDGHEIKREARRLAKWEKV